MLRPILIMMTLLAFVACRKQSQFVSSESVEMPIENAVVENGDTFIYGTPYPPSYISDILAKGEPKDENGDPIYVVTEEMPKYPSGNKALLKYLTVVNPERQGRVTIVFLVGKDGSVRDPKVIRSQGERLDQEALCLVRRMPKWIPGKSKGKQQVTVQYLVPVYFVKNQKEAEQLWDQKCAN